MASKKRTPAIKSPLGKSLTDFVTGGKARRAVRQGRSMIGRAAKAAGKAARNAAASIRGKRR